jgi:hypothetical protein
MISKFIDLLLGYFKGKAYWSRIEPLVAFISLYVVALALAYEYVQWRYNFSTPIEVFVRSYLVKQLTILFATIAVLVLIFVAPSRQAVAGRWEQIRHGVRTLSGRIAFAGLLLVLMLMLLIRVNPERVSHITVQYLNEPDPSTLNKYAFTYIVYELNRSQSTWHFTPDFDTFSPDQLTTAERASCGDDDSLCIANLAAGGRNFVGIQTTALGSDHFWVNSENVSVISTHDWMRETPNVYEYLTYSLIVQSIVIHLNKHCRGLPTGSFRESREAYGELFQFSPRRNEIVASVLAAHLSPKGEELLANCFGMEYMANCNRLLSMDWLRSGRVKNNLEASFGVKF